MPENLVRNAGFAAKAGALPDGWTTWAPRAEVSPRFAVSLAPRSKEPALSAEFVQGARTFGQWEAVVRGVAPGRWYRVSVEALWKGIDSPRECVQMKLAWLADPAKREHVRKEFVSARETTDGVSHKLEMLSECPNGAGALRIELVSKWSRSGAVYWSRPCVAEAEAPEIREVTLAAVSCPKAKSLEENRRRHLAHARAAGEAGADIICLTEAFPRAGTGLSMREAAEGLQGPTFEAMAKVAVETGAYVAGGIDELDGETVYNTMMLVSPAGKLAGKYHKTHLPEAECVAGVAPGEEYPVFETPLGVIGMEVCYDNFFPEPSRALALGGAEIILCAIAGDGREGGSSWEAVSRTRAIDNGVWFVGSIWHPARCLIIDPWGKVLADSGGREGFIAAKAEMSRRKWLKWMSVESEGDWRGLWPNERRMRTYGPLA